MTVSSQMQTADMLKYCCIKQSSPIFQVIIFLHTYVICVIPSIHNQIINYHSPLLSALFAFPYPGSPVLPSLYTPDFVSSFHPQQLPVEPYAVLPYYPESGKRKANTTIPAMVMIPANIFMILSLSTASFSPSYVYIHTTSAFSL